jgi:glycosyltransferase involved in cell wall biosynthesis
MITSHWDERFGIPETIERKDSMDQEQLRAFYKSIDLLIVPSHFETFCNVAAEAIIHGCSVLVSENVGFAEVLRKAGLGRMVIASFDDPSVVAAAIRSLAESTLSKKEQDIVAKIVDPQKVHEDIVRVLTDVITDDL